MINITTAVALVLGACVACTNSAVQPRIELYPGAGARATIENVAGKKPWVIGGMAVCVKDQPVPVTAVRLGNHSHGLRLIEWGVRRNSQIPVGTENPGAAAGRLSAYRGFSHEAITVHCSSEDDADTIAVTLVRTTAAPGYANGFDIGYRHGGSTAYAHFPYVVTLCPKSETNGVCR